MARRTRRPQARRAAPRPPTTAPVTLRIDSLGAQGDGIASWNGETVYVPFSLPGETVIGRLGERRADGFGSSLIEVQNPAASRVSPSCRHYGTCGGCLLQHFDPVAQARWKRDLVVSALAKRGLADVSVEPCVSIGPATRRRVVLAWRKTASGLILGFHERQTHRIVDVTECPVLLPALQALVAALKPELRDLLPAGAAGSLMITMSDTGADCLLDLPAVPDLDGREQLARLAEGADMARLCIRIGNTVEPVSVRRQPVLRIGGTDVALPPGAFLQPSREGEQAILGLIHGYLGNSDGAIADLFCGLGTFSLPLADGHDVTAVDADVSLTAALSATRRVRVVTRNLFTDPLAGAELRDFRAVVFDPPRAGAKAQCEALAADGPRTIVAVSCNPATFARDARILVDGGYRLTSVTPVDQFAWSPHMELVAAFAR